MSSPSESSPSEVGDAPVVLPDAAPQVPPVLNTPDGGGAAVPNTPEPTTPGPDNADGDAEPDPENEELVATPETESDAWERAMDASDAAIKNRHAEIVAKIAAGEKVTPEESALLLVGRYSLGFGEHNFGGTGDGEGSLSTGGLIIETESGKITVDELTSQKIVQNEDDGTPIVMYGFKGRNEADEEVSSTDDDITTYVKGTELSTAQLEQRKDKILTNFSDPKERQLVEWQADGATRDTIPVVEDESDAGEEDNQAESNVESLGRFTRVDKLINKRIISLASKLPKNPDFSQLTPEQQSAFEEIALLQSSMLEGALGVLTREQAVRQIIDNAKKANPREDNTALQAIRGRLGGQVEGAVRELRGNLTDAALGDGILSDEEAAYVVELVQRGDMAELLKPETNEKLKKIHEKNPQVMDILLKGNDEAKVIDFLDKFAAALPEGDKRRNAWGILKGTGLGALGVLAVLFGLVGFGMSALSKQTQTRGA